MSKIESFYNDLKAALFAFVAIVISLLSPIIPLILVVGLFIVADTAIGIWKSLRTKKEITSRRLSNIVSKMVLYQSAIILFFLMEKYILTDFVGYFINIPWFITKVMACVLCSIEIKSIDESFQEVIGISLWDKFKILLKRSSEIKNEIKDLKE